MRIQLTCFILSLFIYSHIMLIFSTKCHLLMIDLVAAFVLFIFMLVLLCFVLLPFLGE